MSFDPSKLRLGLSRLLRYSYGGVLFTVLMSIFYPDLIKQVRTAMGGALSVFSVIVIGAGLYVLHRSIIIPVHHYLLIKFMGRREKKKGIEPGKSSNPVIYIQSLGVSSIVCAMVAYSYLRGAEFFNRQDELNIKHAESGLLVMTSAGLLAGAICDAVCKHKGYFAYMLVGAIIFFIASFPPGWVQHSVECKEMRYKQNEKDKAVTKKLKEAGFLVGEPTSTCKSTESQKPA